MLIGYARVSTDDQNLDLQPGFTHQVARVAEPAQQPRAVVWRQAHSSVPMKL